MIPLSVPNFVGNEKKYVLDAVSREWVSTSGDYIKRMEESISRFLFVDDAVACQSGTSAIHLSLMEAGVKEGDLVIAPTLTFIAAVNPIKYCGADPIFMDCDDSLCIDVDKLRHFIIHECKYVNGRLIHKQSERNIVAIVVVHVFGNMADMESIMDIALKYNLKVVEDATEALGSRYINGKYKGQYAGTIGDFGAYSFNGNKIITTGGGGMVVAKNSSDLNHIRHLSTQAKKNPNSYIHDEIGYNYRMTNVQAALGVAQLENLKDFILIKNNNYDLYSNYFTDKNNVRLLDFSKDIESNKWFYSLYITDPDIINSEEMVKRLNEKNIQTRCIWGLIHMQKPYENSINYKIEKAVHYVERIVNLPCSTSIHADEIRYVCDSIFDVLDCV